MLVTKHTEQQKYIGTDRLSSDVMSKLSGTTLTSSVELSDVNQPPDGVHDRGTSIPSSIIGGIRPIVENTKTNSEAAVDHAIIPSDNVIADQDAVVPKVTVDSVPVPDEITTDQGSVFKSISSKTTTSAENRSNHVTKTDEKLVLDGSCPFDRLPPLGKKIVRIFVSSTFSGS